MECAHLRNAANDKLRGRVTVWGNFVPENSEAPDSSKLNIPPHPYYDQNMVFLVCDWENVLMKYRVHWIGFKNERIEHR